MRGVLGAVFALFAAAVSGQEATDYTTAENPYQAEYAYASGQPIVMRVDIQRVLIDSITITAPSTLPPDGKVECSVRVSGANEAARKITVTAVLLLEDAKSEALERLSLAPIRVKAGRALAAEQSLEVGAAALAAAARVYVFVKID